MESLGEIEIDSNVGKVMNLLLGVLVEVVASVLTRKKWPFAWEFSGDFFVGDQPLNGGLRNPHPNSHQMQKLWNVASICRIFLLKGELKRFCRANF